MRIGLLGWGSEGDLRPLVALGAALRRAGHSVRLDLSPVDGSDFAPLCRRLDLPLRVLPETLDFALHTVARDADSVDPLRVSRELVERAFNPYLELLFEKARELCAASDLVVWQYSAWYAKAAALKEGIPHAALHLFPGVAPTATAPPPGLPNAGPLNRALWWVAARMLDAQFRKRPAAFFAAHQLPPLRHVMPELLFSEHLNLHAFSRQLVPPPPDWNATHQVTGHWALPDDAAPWSPSPELAEFLAAGPRPVLLSLGSMEHLAPRRARELLVAAARASGTRTILQSKRLDAAEGRDKDLYFLRWAPHAALLPHCSLMVHHGGAGTAHAALAAGLPSVVVPVIFEQQLWAKRLRAAGVSPKAVPFWKATPELLGGRISEALATAPLRERARQHALAMASEGGAERAVELLVAR